MIKGIVQTPLVEGRTVVIYDADWYRKKITSPWRKKLGAFCFSFSLAGFLLFLSPLLAPKLIKEEKGFKPIIAQKIKPQKKNFLLSIEKIGLVNAKVIPQVNIGDEGEYKQTLQKGLAHAQGTAFPGQGKMIYIFGHSTNYPWFVDDLNALFFKLETLEPDDKIKIEYNGQHFYYYVIEKKVVKADEVKIIHENLDKDVLVLQTCYPPGTFWKRLLIFAKPSKFASLI